MEGKLELSLRALRYAINKKERDKLEFPIRLQVLEATSCWVRARQGESALRQIITVSDGFYKRSDCFIVNTANKIEAYSIIEVRNIDFEVSIERGRKSNGKRVPIVAHILDFEVLVPGSHIGNYSGKPSSLDSFKEGIIEPKSQLSDKLWEQMKQGKGCDVTFKFSHIAGTPTVLAQKNPLIANSDVFEALFEGGYREDAGVIEILDSEPQYVQSMLQYLFTQFVPFLNLRHAFEVLYLAKKYMIKDLEQFCRSFIIKKKSKESSQPEDIFKYMELNLKCCDDEVSEFVMLEFKQYAGEFIRKPQFLELDFASLETFLSLPRMNAHEWELLQALRRWVVSKGLNASCPIAAEGEEEVGEGEDKQCIHQLLECIRFKYMALKETVMAITWPELGLNTDSEFLTDLLDSESGQAVPTKERLTYTLNQGYSVYRWDDHVIYTNLMLDLTRETVDCLQGNPSMTINHPSPTNMSLGPPYVMNETVIKPRYWIEWKNKYLPMGPTVKNLLLTVVIDVDGYIGKVNNPPQITGEAELKLFSFKPHVPAKQIRKPIPNRSIDGLSLSLELTRSELANYTYTWQGRSQVVDLQVKFILIEQGRRRAAFSVKVPLRSTTPEAVIQVETDYSENEPDRDDDDDVDWSHRFTDRPRSLSSRSMSHSRSRSPPGRTYRVGPDSDFPRGGYSGWYLQPRSRTRSRSRRRSMSRSRSRTQSRRWSSPSTHPCSPSYLPPSQRSPNSESPTRQRFMPPLSPGSPSRAEYKYNPRSPSPDW